MAQYSQNTTIKVGSVVNVTSTASSGTLYTVPANSYLHLTSYYFNRSPGFGGSNSSVSVTIGNLGTVTAFAASGGATVSYDSLSGTIERTGTANAQAGSAPLLVGPGQTITWSNSSGGGSPANSANIKGILFVNTP